MNVYVSVDVMASLYGFSSSVGDWVVGVGWAVLSEPVRLLFWVADVSDLEVLVVF